MNLFLHSSGATPFTWSASSPWSQGDTDKGPREPLNVQPCRGIFSLLTTGLVTFPSSLGPSAF